MFLDPPKYNFKFEFNRSLYSDKSVNEVVVVFSQVAVPEFVTIIPE